MKYSYEIIV